jgi:hypothetical protein
MLLKYSIDDIQTIALAEGISLDQFLIDNKEYKEEDGFIYLILK